MFLPFIDISNNPISFFAASNLGVGIVSRPTFCYIYVPQCKSNALYYFPKVNVLGLFIDISNDLNSFFFAASNLGVEHVYETPSKHEAVNGVTSPSSSARSSRLSAGSNGFFRDSGNDTMYTSSGKAN